MAILPPIRANEQFERKIVASSKELFHNIGDAQGYARGVHPHGRRRRWDINSSASMSLNAHPITDPSSSTAVLRIKLLRNIKVRTDVRAQPSGSFVAG